MLKVKVLIEGYAREESGIEFASSSVVLIRDNGANVIVDPGMNRKMLLDGLAHEGFKIEDINYVILTHTHIDHSLLSGIFCNAKILDDSAIYSFDGRISDHGGKIPNSNIEIIKTPGHDQFHCSVLINTEDLGKVIIAGDVFWWKEGEELEKNTQSLLDYEDPYVKDKEALRKSREKILGMADWIIPGHGKMFKSNK